MIALNITTTFLVKVHMQAVTAQEWSRGATPHPRPRAAAERSYPVIEVRGSSREEQSHVQGAVAARAQEGLEELFHVQGQEGWL